MNSGNNPDIDPANNDSLTGTIRFAFYKMLQNVNGMLPAQVVNYDRTTNRVQVQLLITQVTTSGAQVSRPQISSLPVCIFGGGDFFISFNLNPGDLGWVIANDRDISLFLQTLNQTPPNTGRIKSFSDGLFIPNVMTNWNIASEDNKNCVIQSTDGSVVISLSQTGLAPYPNRVTITAPYVKITNTTTALLGVNGNIIASGTITPSGVVPP